MKDWVIKGSKLSKGHQFILVHPNLSQGCQIKIAFPNKFFKGNIFIRNLYGIAKYQAWRRRWRSLGLYIIIPKDGKKIRR